MTRHRPHPSRTLAPTNPAPSETDFPGKERVTQFLSRCLGWADGKHRGQGYLIQTEGREQRARPPRLD